MKSQPDSGSTLRGRSISRAPVKRRRTGASTKSASEKADEALRIAKLATKIASSKEIKVFGTYANYNSFTENGQLVRLNAISQGVGDNQRVGDRIMMKTLGVKMSVLNSDSAYIRVIILYAPEAKITAASDVVEGVATVFAPFTFKPYDKRKWSRILWDKTYALDDPATSGLMYNEEFNLPINRPTQFDAATTTINAGDLFVLFVSNSAVAEQTLVFSYRLYYTDT